ncbi:MAG: hypothetical protein LBD76_00115 [Prevotellaceae bacterium]|nr:hypothetical protein [Prevotellaceae bacterium]
MKEDWEEAEFKEMEVETGLGTSKMKLQEKETDISNYSMREVYFAEVLQM